VAMDPKDDASRPSGSRSALPSGRRGRGHDRHPGVELLDAVAGGEQVTRSAREHIERCSVCRESVAALRRVRADLSRLAAMTMPGDVADRIQAALATRMPAHPSAPSGPPGPPSHADLSSQADAHIPPGDVQQDRSHAPAAALAELASGSGSTAGGASQPADDPGGDRPAGHHVGTGPDDGTRIPTTGRPAARSRPDGRRPRRIRRPGGPRPEAPRTDWVSIAAVCIAFVTFGAAILAFYGLRSPSVAPASNPAAGHIPVDAAAAAAAEPVAPEVTTVLADSRSSLAAVRDLVRHGQALMTGQIAGSLALPLELSDASAGGASQPRSSAEPAGSGGAAATGAGAGSGAAGSGAAPRAAVQVPASAVASAASLRSVALAAAAVRLRALLDTPELRTCYQSLLAQSGGAILGIDRVRYDGRPALLIVLSVPMQPSSARLLVVDPQCGMTSAYSAPIYSVSALRG
jgi:hypothetical protein